MNSNRSRGLKGRCIEIEDLKVRPLTDEERVEQHEQLRRAWWLKLLFRRHYMKCREFQ